MASLLSGHGRGSAFFSLACLLPDWQTLMTKHPAKFSDPILSVMGEMLHDVKGVALDPFAGTGKVHLLQRPTLRTVGVEIEPEWAHLHPQTVVGNALDLPFGANSFDAAITSPCYGNRMADHHDARDDSKRNTYKHTLGRDLHPDNSGQLQWGDDYKMFHILAWNELIRVLKPRGFFLLNVSDHIRKGEAVPVTEFHLNYLGNFFDTVDVRTVSTLRFREGSNSDLRVPHESVVLLRKS